MISPEEWLETYDHVGHFCPYYCYNNTNKLYICIGEALEMLPVEERRIDPVAIVEYLAKTYVLADRTMVQNINRTPGGPGLLTRDGIMLPYQNMVFVVYR